MQDEVREVRELLDVAKGKIKENKLEGVKANIEKAARLAFKAKPAQGKPPEADELEVGTLIYLTNLGQNGKVLSVSGKTVSCLVGGLRVNAKLRDLRISSEEPEKSAAKSVSYSGEHEPLSSIVDLRGFRVLAAEEHMERVVDQALLSGFDLIEVVHGEGTGAIKKWLRKWAESHRGISQWEAVHDRHERDSKTMLHLG